jgi:hypothetical protein
MSGILDVTNKSTSEVVNWLDGIEKAFALFDEWLPKQELDFNERRVAETIFNLKFASLPMSALTQAQIARHRIGEKRHAEIAEMVRRFAIDNGLATEAECDEE